MANNRSRAFPAHGLCNVSAAAESIASFGLASLVKLSCSPFDHNWCLIPLSGADTVFYSLGSRERETSKIGDAAVSEWEHAHPTLHVAYGFASYCCTVACSFEQATGL